MWTVPEDDLSSINARPSPGMVLTKEMFSLKICDYHWFSVTVCLDNFTDDISVDI